MSAYKTPTGRVRTRSEAKTPLTPSFVNGLNSNSIAPSVRTRKKSTTTMADTTNPFISNPSSSSSRPSSPVSKSISGSFQVTDSLARQAKSGVIRKGGVESRLDVVKNDYVPPTKPELKKSKSTGNLNTGTRDRFITRRDVDVNEVAASLDLMTLDQPAGSPRHTARLAEATGVPVGRRVLAYHEPPPPADQTLAQQREYAKPLYARPGPLPGSTGATTNKTRKISTQPERVLDAPGLVDDFYLNLLSWSCQNIVAVALNESTYVWKADTGSVSQVGEAPEGSYVSSVSFSADGAFLGVGCGTGEVELWDPEAGTKLRTMLGHQGQIATLSWNGHILSSGCGDGSIWHHDVRIARHKVMELLGHTGEVCGLTWRQDGELIASGGNDNVVNIWDSRIGEATTSSREDAKWTKRNHTAAVKALSWSPWNPSLLASGGGTNDATINVWNSTSGARLHTLKTPSQVTNLHWSPQRKEIMSTHGYPTNSLMIHAYPSMECVAEIRDAHDSRVLYSALSPGGDVVITGAGDENLKFWRVWEGPKEKKRKEVKENRMTSSSRGILSIR